MTEAILDEKQIYPTSEFVSGKWNKEINVRDFIQNNYTLYEGDSSFLADPTEATKPGLNPASELKKAGY